jgi:hypothetical protein
MVYQKSYKYGLITWLLFKTMVLSVFDLAPPFAIGSLPRLVGGKEGNLVTFFKAAAYFFSFDS